MPDLNDLSEREREILTLIAQGASNKEIAMALTISANTVKVHLRNIFAKIQVASRTEAALFAVSVGLVDPAGAQANGQPAREFPAEPIVELAPTRRERRSFLALGLVLGVLILLGVFLLRNRLLDSQASASTPGPTPPPRWQELASLPTPRLGLAVAPFGNLVYAFAGEDQQGVSGQVEYFDPLRDRWQALAPKPLPVADVSAGVIGGKFYLPGGRTASGEPTAAMEIYDPRTDTWEQGPALPVALSAYALVVYEGKLYVFGGWDGRAVVDSVYAFDPDRSAWLALTPMPTARAFAGAGVSVGRIYVFGGSDGEKPLDVTEVYSPEQDDGSANPWAAGDPIPQPRYAMGVASLADIIHVIGGVGEGNTVLPALEFPPQGTGWQAFDMPITQAWSGMGIAPLGTQLYLIGGGLGGAPSAQNLAYQAIYVVSLPVIR